MLGLFDEDGRRNDVAQYATNVKCGDVVILYYLRCGDDNSEFDIFRVSF